jgi:hypothetical protein
VEGPYNKMFTIVTKAKVSFHSNHTNNDFFPKKLLVLKFLKFLLFSECRVLNPEFVNMSS